MNNIKPKHNDIKNILLKYNIKLIDIHKKGIITNKFTKSLLTQINTRKIIQEINYYTFLTNKSKQINKKKDYLIKVILLKQFLNPINQRSNVYIILNIINNFKLINHGNYNIRNITNIINLLCENMDVYDVYDVIDLSFTYDELLNIN
jgi:hypothetical protein